jgi:hypothetical protein
MWGDGRIQNLCILQGSIFKPWTLNLHGNSTSTQRNLRQHSDVISCLHHPSLMSGQSDYTNFNPLPVFVLWRITTENHTQNQIQNSRKVISPPPPVHSHLLHWRATINLSTCMWMHKIKYVFNVDSSPLSDIGNSAWIFLFSSSDFPGTSAFYALCRSHKTCNKIVTNKWTTNDVVQRRHRYPKVNSIGL